MSTSNLSYKPLENAKHELFCQKYCLMGTEFFCNGTKSYGLAYWIDISDKEKYNIAKSWAYKLLTNAYILKRIEELLDEWGLNDHSVDLQLLLLIKQDFNIPAKLWAIREYNRLRNRRIEKKDSILQKIDVSKMTQQEKINYLQSKLRGN